MTVVVTDAGSETSSIPVTATVDIVTNVPLPIGLEDYTCTNWQFQEADWINDDQGVTWSGRGVYAAAPSPTPEMTTTPVAPSPVRIYRMLEGTGPWSVVFAANQATLFDVLNGPSPTDMSVVSRTLDGRYEIHEPYIALQWTAATPYDEASTLVFTHFCIQTMPAMNLTVETLITKDMVTNYDTLEVSGNLVAEIRNTGAVKITTPFKVIFFEDLDGSKDFTPAQGDSPGDRILAESIKPELLPNTTTIVTAKASGTLEFAGDLVYVDVDYTDVVIETNEDDNLLYAKCPEPMAVISFTLFQDTDTVIHHLVENDVLTLSTLPSTALGIRADVSDSVGSVIFTINAAPGTSTDDESPYNLTEEWSFIPGSYTLKATPYELDGGLGAAGTPLTIHFTIVN